MDDGRVIYNNEMLFSVAKVVLVWRDWFVGCGEEEDVCRREKED